MSQTTPHSTQLEFFEIPSPCVGVCESGARGFCKGCYRSREERLYWLKIDDATRRKIISACQRRKRAALRRKSEEGKGLSSNDKPVQTSLFDEDNE